jgi:hypothetical protein
VLPRLIQLPHSGAHRPLKVRRPSRDSVIVLFRPTDLPGGSAVTSFRSLDLLATPSSSTSGRQTSRRLRHRPFQQKVVGSFSLLEHQTDHSGRFTAQGLLHECIL